MTSVSAIIIIRIIIFIIDIVQNTKTKEIIILIDIDNIIADRRFVSGTTCCQVDYYYGRPVENILGSYKQHLFR